MNWLALSFTDSGETLAKLIALEFGYDKDWIIYGDKS